MWEERAEGQEVGRCRLAAMSGRLAKSCRAAAQPNSVSQRFRVFLNFLLLRGTELYPRLIDSSGYENADILWCECCTEWDILLS